MRRRTLIKKEKSMIRILIFSIFFILTSFQMDKFNYEFEISITENANRIPKKLTIQIINNESSDIQLNNLVFFILLDNGKGFNGTMDRIRFLDKKLIIKSQKKFKQNILFDSLIFTSFGDNKTVLFENVKKEIIQSKEIKIYATISDMRRFENPLNSSSLSYSNTIDLSDK